MGGNKHTIKSKHNATQPGHRTTKCALAKQATNTIQNNRKSKTQPMPEHNKQQEIKEQTYRITPILNRKQKPTHTPKNKNGETYKIGEPSEKEPEGK